MTDSKPIDTCRSCPARIVWAVSERGKRMPVDADPSPAGNLVLEYADGALPVARRVTRDPENPRTDLHTAHFVTCPHAQQWRGRKVGTP